MSRPTLLLEELVLRPGYVEVMSLLSADYRETGATLPQLLLSMGRPKGFTPRKMAVRMRHRLQRLEKEGLVRYDKFDPGYFRRLTAPPGSNLGRPPTGRWIITERGTEVLEDRLSVAYAKEIGERILSMPRDRKHVTHIGVPTILVVTTDVVRQDSDALRRLIEGPVLRLGPTAKETALRIWAENPRVGADWKTLRTLREKHPRKSIHELSIPESLALKDWHPSVRAAQRRLEGHRVIICLEVNPAYWEGLPIDQLKGLQTKIRKSRKLRERIRARSRARRGIGDASRP